MPKIRFSLLAALVAQLFHFSSTPATATSRPGFLEFPANFQWCAATSPHQIEGNNIHSDWWSWEEKQNPCKIKNCEKSSNAADHWNRVEEDTSLIKNLGLNTYRMGIEWSKIEPHPGEINWEAVMHYQNEIQLLEKSGIQVILTLQHFTLPQWVAEKGGWSWKELPKLFEKYSEFVVTTIAPNVRDIVTINEPLVHLSGSYLLGITPPGLGNSDSAPSYEKGAIDREWMHGLRFINSVNECGDLAHSFVAGISTKKEDLERIIAPARGLLAAHALAYHRIHEVRSSQNREVRVGMAHHLRWMTPRNRLSVLDQLITGILDQVWNWTVPDALESGVLRLSIPTLIDYEEKIAGLKGTQDFIGINYYTRDSIAFRWKNGISPEVGPTPGSLVNDLGWEISPKGFEQVLNAASFRIPNRPILVTENGIADCTDRYRPIYIQSHLEALHRAMDNGVQVEGYCHWSLMDNFEWLEGFAPRFGLYEVNYTTQARTPRVSAYLFSRIAKDNGIYQGR